MKRNLLLLLTILLLSLGKSMANTVVVKGTVRDSANNPVANRTVLIYNNDSTLQNCLIAHKVVTNPNGYYIDTLQCNGDIRKLMIVVENCNGAKIIQQPTSTNATVEVNFVICVPGTAPGCKAGFSATPTNTGFKFNSSSSFVPAGDSIISRTWVFGDSSQPLTGNRVDPTHEYAKAGIYSVCLTIKTKKGCESKFCTTVEYKPAQTNCYVEVHASIERSTILKFRFPSTIVKIAPGDSVVLRSWTFGDGTGIQNVENPIKEYKDTGIYNVCVKVKTARGCEHQFCFKVEARDSVVKPTSCKAYFTTTVKDSIVYFSSKGSTVPDGDSIVSRTWYYIDSASNTQLVLGGNTVDTFINHHAKPGKYTIYLVIKTKKGCESKFTGTVTVPYPVNTCLLQPNVSFEKISTFKVRFNSSKTVAQGDSIISRKWLFGDGTKLDGNEISPLKEYKDTGVYKASVTFKTKNGCEKTYSLVVIIRDSLQQPPTCKAQFTFTIQNGVVKFNSAGSAGTSPEDSIISRTWIFGDSSAAVNNYIDPSHTYTKPGTYTVYLYIKTKKGCENKFTGTVVIPAPANCKAQFTFTVQNATVKFNSEGSTGISAEDSIISRTWIFGDSSAAVVNSIDPSHTYTKPGTYTVYLYIKTKKGCENKFTGTVVIPAPANCKAQFTFTVQNATVKFNSAGSVGTSNDDEIISRTWVFGDSSTAGSSGNNAVDPSHTYSKPGTYTVYLYIKTKKGCESKFTGTIVIAPNPTNCPVEVSFISTRISPKKIQFTDQSHAINGDSIIQRKWKFGDGTALEGNTLNPVKEFPMVGIYNTCLEVKTAKGCTAQVCKQVVLQDTTNLPPVSTDHIKLVSLTPNPVVTRMLATVWSSGNIEVEITTYDVYGQPKGKMKKALTKGTNIIEIPVANLYRGPYYLTVSSRNEKDSKIFYKL